MKTKPVKTRIAKGVCLIVLLCALLSLSGCSGHEETIGSIADLNGKSIVAISGSTNAAQVKLHPGLADSELIYALNNPAALSMLLAGKADAMACDSVYALSMQQQYDSLTVLEEMPDDDQFGIAFGNESPLVDEFNNVITELKDSGELTAMAEKWLGTDKSLKTVSDQTWPGSSGTLLCAIASNYEPLCYPDESGHPIGLDIDLILTVAKELDYHIEFTETAFEDLLPSVAAGQADLAASGITITEERNAAADFSVGYLDAGTVLLVRGAGASAKGEGLLLSVSNSLRRVFVDGDHWILILRGIGTTLLLSVLTLITGGMFGSIAFLWEYSGSKAARKFMGILSSILLLLPITTYLFIIYFLVFAGKSGNGMGAAIVAFTITFGLSVYQSLNASVGSLNQGQTEASRSMGYSRYQALFKIFLPQARPAFLASMEGAVVNHIRGTALAELIAVQDLQSVADMIRAETSEPFLPVVFPAVIYVLLSLLAGRLVRSLRMRTDPTAKSAEEIKERAMKGRL